MEYKVFMFNNADIRFVPACQCMLSQEALCLLVSAQLIWLPTYHLITVKVGQCVRTFTYFTGGTALLVSG